MRVLLRGLWIGLLASLAALPLLALAAWATLWLALQAEPMVPAGPGIVAADIERARALFKRHDPRRTLPGVQRAVALSPRDIELLVDQAGARMGQALPGGAARQARVRVALQPGLAHVRASLAVPDNPLGRWLNIDLVLAETQALPEVQSLRLGAVPVPGWLAQRALPRLLEALGLQAQGDLAQRIVSRVQFTGQLAVVAFAWPAQLRQSLAASLLQPEEQDRLRMYVERLAAVAPVRPANRRVALTALLPPVFALARQRTESGQSAERENRAALLALTLVANPGILQALVPAAQQWTPVRPMVVVLHGRSDTPLHWLVSAVLAAEGGGPLADAIGLYKEMADARGGSGFSFHDLAADRAGTRLGQRARRDALALQQRLATPLADTDLLPDVSDLPENLPEAEFQRRYGGIDAPAYRAMLAGIEQRLNKLPLLKGTP